MTDRSMARFDDTALEGALRSLSSSIEWPTAAPVAASGAPAGPDIATRVRARLTDPDRRRTRRPWWQGSWRPLRRSLVLALVALLALAIVAGAVGLGLPGLRFIFGGGPPPPTPTIAPTVAPGATPTSTPTQPREPGATLGLGELVPLEGVEELTGIPVRLPADPRLGAPDAVWVDVSKNNQVAYVWASDADLPETNEPGVGLVLMRFDGTTDPGFFEKVIGTGTHLEMVQVDGHDGFWITGDPHFFYYVRDGQQYFDEDRRWVGDALIWSDGTTTFRIESGLGRDETVAIAESIESGGP
jgi:hypothetical protein